MSISEWPINVPNIEDGITTFSANDVNPIIQSLTTRTDWLRDKLNNLTGSFGFSYTDEGFDSSCKKGMLIAQDPETKKYYPAEASWSDKVRADGSIVPSWKANVIGVLLTDVLTSSNQSDGRSFGSIQVFGCISDLEIVDILAPNRIVDSYYLDSNGVATAGIENKNLPVWCFSYLASGKIFLAPKSPEYGGHSHNYININGKLWKPAAGAAISLPSDAKMVIDVSDKGNEALNSIVKSNPNHLCLVKNGQEVLKSQWGITSDLDAIFLKFYLTDGDELSLHAITPLTADEPLLRSIQTTRDNNLLKIDSVGGNVFVGLNIENTDRSAYTGYGVTSLDEYGLKLGPVIQGIKAGAGIDVKSYSDKGATVAGVVEISSTQYKNTLIDMNLCNLNGVLVGTDINEVSYIFPSGVMSSLTGTMRIPNFIDNTNQTGELVFVFQGNGQSISGMEASVLIQPTPQPPTAENDGSTSIATPVVHKVPATSGSDTGKCYCSVISLGGNNQTIYSSGLIICTLISSGSSKIKLLSASFRLT